MRSSLAVERFEPVRRPLGHWNLSNYGRRRALCELKRQGRLPAIGGASGQFSGYTEQAGLNHLTGNDNAAWANLNTQYLALCTAVPTSSNTGSTITEATYTGYARLNISNWAAAASGTAPASASVGSTTGYVYPSVGANNAGIGSSAWTNPTNIQGQGPGGGSYAAAPAGTTNYLFATGYGFTIPTGATILGIQAGITGYCNTGGTCTDNVVSLLKAGTVTGSNYAANSWTTSTATYFYGGSSNLWGSTWAPSDINNANFGLAFSGNAAGAFARCVSMELAVYYTFQFANCTGGTSTVVAVARCTALTAGNMLAWASVPSTVISSTQTPATLSTLVSTLT